ncbi:MAG TPA: iron-sulfur cluster assembly scaffold protein [Anaerovoracaceae bacterium]|nr:iron-sulfur cluster assembly scaffold protein [Anaerovoracaceae bacterium]
MNDNMYNDIVMDHFLNPRNVGEMENPDGIGIYGSPTCGDLMQIHIKVKDDVIIDAKFKAFGCGSAIASSSMATTLIVGLTLEEALNLTNGEIVEKLEGLPEAKVHCSVLADKAIKKAIYDYAINNGKKYDALKDFDPYEMAEDEHKCICGRKDNENE